MENLRLSRVPAHRFYEIMNECYKKEILFLSKDRILIKYRNEVYEFKITLE